MKKLIAMVLSVAMVISFAACGKKDDQKESGNNDNQATATVTVTPEADEEDKVTFIIPEISENTAGSALWNDFLAAVKEKPDTSAIDLANKLSTNSVIQFMAGAMETEPGYLAGFSEEITGFESGATYGPMMGSIAFVGHIFKLADGADVNAFVENLKSKADPRWNICVSADFVQAGAYGNTVYFLMYPASMDQTTNAGENGGADVSEAEVIRPEVKENTWGALLWETFEAVMNEQPTPSALDAAFALSMDETIPFVAVSSEVEQGYLAGFDEEIHGFKSAGSFGPMIGSIAFIGYVFELEDGADVNAFMATLSEHSNPRWNICVEADQTVIGAVGNKVFFLMCPETNGEKEPIE